jgi:hypothetical protein
MSTAQCAPWTSDYQSYESLTILTGDPPMPTLMATFDTDSCCVTMSTQYFCWRPTLNAGFILRTDEFGIDYPSITNQPYGSAPRSPESGTTQSRAVELEEFELNVTSDRLASLVSLSVILTFVYFSFFFIYRLGSQGSATLSFVPLEVFSTPSRNHVFRPGR